MMSIADLLNRAKVCIEAGENNLHQPAENIAAASEQGATQRKIAEVVGKSAAWVNGLLKWRLAGYPATAFGPQAKASRARADHVQSTEQQKPKQAQASAARAQADKAKAAAAKAKADAAKAKADAARAKANARKARDDYFSNLFHGPKKKIHSDPRELLVKSLGMLGSEHQGERDPAACMAEKQRKKTRYELG
jgi:hypothetical protein